MLEASLAYYQQFLEDRKDDPTISDELAKAKGRMEDIYNRILAEMSTWMNSSASCLLRSSWSYQRFWKASYSFQASSGAIESPAAVSESRIA